MAIIKYKPTSPGRRFQTGSDFKEITSDAPEKSLVRPLKKTGGETVTGESRAGISVAGTSASTASSISEETRSTCPLKVASIEYDPNRSSRIALLHYRDGEKRYIIAPAKLEVGNLSSAVRKPTSSRELPSTEKHPMGSLIHN